MDGNGVASSGDIVLTNNATHDTGMLTFALPYPRITANTTQQWIAAFSLGWQTPSNITFGLALPAATNVTAQFNHLAGPAAVPTGSFPINSPVFTLRRRLQ